MSKYVWCEDSGSGFDFWTYLFRELDPDIIVQSKRSNSDLRKAVASISEDNDDHYYILVDNAVDNPDVLREVKKLTEISQRKKQVVILKIHSFEFVLLSFKDLENWIFAPEDDLRESRKDLLHWKDIFVNAFTDLQNADILNTVKEALKYSKKYNSEQLSAKMLFDITRNTGFETNKGNLGKCFVVDCCTWEERQQDDICGLDDHRITSADKMRCIYEKSVLKNALAEAGV